MIARAQQAGGTATLRAGMAPRAKRLLLGSGFYSVFRRVLPSRRLAILRYHAVCARDGAYAEPEICVTPQAFERHIAYLSSHYRVMPLPEAVAALRRGATLPPNAVCITFDDGYGDNLEAARTLARYRLTATFYLTAGCLADGAPFWPSELRALVAALEGPSIHLDAGGVSLDLPLRTPAERRGAVRRLTKTFKAHAIPVREALREALRQQARRAPQPSPMLTWEQVREMRRLGMEIGSHTMTHPNLPNAGADAAEREVVDSKARLEAELGAPVTMFSYPNGGAERYMTRQVAELVERAGYDAATTSRNAFAGPESDPFALERVQVSEELENLVFALEVERFAFKPRPRPFERVTPSDRGDRR